MGLIGLIGLILSGEEEQLYLFESEFPALYEPLAFLVGQFDCVH